ncbi:protein lingerer isoform X2 [Leptopilina boulardi]|uniref:protein lingerer isoform X2 n=1 Tax=Leptopilina boulardi TaxID=63433 RepID=UPI0021F62365|nr:protein lingerer isoform X2 [Leptopilina boulardi]
MSSGNKSSVSSGGRGTSKNKTSQHGKSDHQFKSSDSTKQDKIQQKSDQTRHAQIIDTRMGGGEDPTFKERVKQVMEVTRRTEDEVIMALHDSDGDFNRAVNDLLEGVSPEWEVKKKKARQPSSSKQNIEQLGVQDEGGEWESERRVQRGGGPPRMRGRANHDNRGWRGRENKENERNMEESGRDSGFQGGNRRGRGGPGRSGRGGRGGGRGLGPRTFANRGDPSSSSHSFNRPIETWTGSEEQQQSIQEPKMDAWNNLEPSEDWDNEEYQGSLADTKVFTPSTSLTDEQKLQDLQSQTIQTVTLTPLQQEDLPKLSDMPVMQQSLGPQQSQTAQHPVLSMPTMQLNQQTNAVSSGALTAAQTQYFTQLTQQSNETLKTAGQASYSSTISSQPQRQTKQRPRIPPPSKIPSSAVEMPGDAVNSSIGILDVQFGAMDFGADTSSLDGSLSDKYTASTTISIDMNSNSNTSNTASSTTNSLDMESMQSTTYNTSGQMLANDSLSSSDHSLNSQSFTNRGSATTQSLDISKQDFTSQVSPNATNYGSTATYPSQKTSFQAQNTTSNSYNVYSTSTQSAQSFPSVTVGNSNSYSATVSVSQASYNTSASYPQSSSASFSQVSPSVSVSAAAVYNQPATTNQTYQSTSAYAPTTTTSSQYQGQSIATNTVNSNSNNSNNSAYQTTGYQGSSSFQSAPQSYQSSSASFSSPITQGSGVYQNASVYAYSTYGSQSQTASHNHKLNSTGNKDSQYETSTTTSNSSLATTTTTQNLGLSSSSANSSQTKVTNSNAAPKSTSSGIVTGTGNTGNMTVAGATNNMTPAILGHQYIMGQSVPGVFPTYQQMYSYEELQMMRQMQPHMPTTGYYDAALGYQTTGPATSLGANRGDALSGVQGVQGVQGAYTSISDARFARNDSNASPVPSTMSQQTATQHQQPMMNAIPPPGYYFTYGMPGGFQYGTPLYPIATAGNAGTSSGAYSAKPGSYGSSYGGGTSYDSLASTGPAAEYKGAGSGYTGSQTGKSGTSTGNTNSSGSTAADISAGMYATKSHVALSKVNSYDKQTFHSATPPPFGLTGSQNAGLPGSYGTPHLFIPAMHQPHQLHQPLHQDGGNSTGQRTNPSSQNKAQTKPGYSPSYWTGGN